LFSALRFSAAAIPIVFLLGKRPPTAWRYIFGIGIVLGVIKFSFLFVGMDIGMSAGLASLVLQTQAFFTAILGFVLFSERMGRRQVIGMLIAFVGIGVLGTELDSVQTTAAGLGLVLAAAFSWAGSNLLMKAAKPRDVLELMVWISLVPPLPMLALSYAIEGPDAMVRALSSIDWVGLGAIFYVGIVSTIGAFAVWGHLLRRYDSVRVAPFSLLVPIFGMTFSVIILGEVFTPAKLVAATLVLTGLAMNVWRPAWRPRFTRWRAG
jgi:O-acetylserine/cysteine efflux transporter